jgi:hypothetical protein
MEIVVDEPVIAKILGKLPCNWMPDHEQEIYLDLNWDEKVTFARQMGLAAVGIYHWEPLGSYQVRDRRVISREPLIRSRADLGKLRVPKLTADDLYPEVERALAAIGDTGIALFAEFPFGFDPTVGDLGFENFCFQISDDPAFVVEVFKRYEEHIGNLIDIYSSMPEIDFIWIGDDIAFRSGPYLSPAMLREYVFPVFQRLASRIQKPWIYHSDGNMSLVLEDIIALGCRVLHPIEPECNDIYKLKEIVGDRICLHGNLSVDIIARGTSEQVIDETWRLLAQLGQEGGYIFSSGNSIPYYANVDNVVAMAQTVERFNAERFE